MRLAYWIGMRRCPSWTKTTARRSRRRRGSGRRASSSAPPFDPGADRRRRVRDDRGEDEDRDPVADAALRDQLAHPHEQRRAGGERDDDQHEAAGVRACSASCALEEVRVAERLRGGERDRQVARVLVDLGVARPRPPSAAARASGSTTVRSWRMIDAVTYGMIPSAKIENRDSALPENRFSRPSTVPPWLVEVALDLRPSRRPAPASTSRGGRARGSSP